MVLPRLPGQKQHQENNPLDGGLVLVYQRAGELRALGRDGRQGRALAMIAKML